MVGNVYCCMACQHTITLRIKTIQSIMHRIKFDKTATKMGCHPTLYLNSIHTKTPYIGIFTE